MNRELKQPLVSVVIPTHGRRELLEQTLRSVFTQTLVDWEAIVVDDDSPDNTWDWLEQIASTEPRVRPLRRQGNVGGANVSRNQGLSASVGKYIIFLDSDDLLEPDCLRLRAQYLEAHPELDFTVHAMRCFESQPNDTNQTWNTLTEEDDFERYLQMDGPWQTTCATWRRSSLAKVGPWDPQLLSLQDLDFHIRAIAAGLRYQKINAWDCHYRLPHKRKSITAEKRSLAQCKSHLQIAIRLLALPDTVLDATPHRRDLLGGFSFLLADRCAQKGGLITAAALWNRVRKRGIAGTGRFIEGLVILISHKRPAFAGKLKSRILARWPKSWQMVFRDTYLKGPLPSHASAVADTILDGLKISSHSDHPLRKTA